MGPHSTSGLRGTAGARELLVALGALSILPPYLGPLVGLELDVSSSVEFVDHVVPGIAVVGLGLVAALRARTRHGDDGVTQAATGACLLAGLWNATSHVPLWLEAGDAERPWGAVVLHGTLGPLVALLAFWVLTRPAEPA